MNAALYPADWPAVSKRIRERSGGKCECKGQCGKAHPAKRCLAVNGRPIDATESRTSLVVLTVAHLNHTPGDCRDSNLRAFCQRCHLAYDRDLHTENATRTRRTKKEAAHEAAGQGRLL